MDWCNGLRFSNDLIRARNKSEQSPFVQILQTVKVKVARVLLENSANTKKKTTMCCFRCAVVMSSFLQTKKREITRPRALATALRFEYFRAVSTVNCVRYAVPTCQFSRGVYRLIGERNNVEWCEFSCGVNGGLAPGTHNIDKYLPLTSRGNRRAESGHCKTRTTNANWVH